MSRIPKIIHFCWLSNNTIPDDMLSYMKTWKVLFPDYQIIKWDFSKFPKEKSRWVSEAYDMRKYAFAADYIRLYALYTYGGIYMDMDVEVIKRFDDFLDLPIMACFENSDRKGIEAGIIGAPKGARWVEDCLNYYCGRSFIQKRGVLDTKVLPEIIKETLTMKNYKLIEVRSLDECGKIVEDKSLPIFDYHFFSPKSYQNGKIDIDSRTHSIHHFAGTWHNWTSAVYKMVGKAIGPRRAKRISEMIKKLLLR